MSTHTSPLSSIVSPSGVCSKAARRLRGGTCVCSSSRSWPQPWVSWAPLWPGSLGGPTRSCSRPWSCSSPVWCRRGCCSGSDRHALRGRSTSNCSEGRAHRWATSRREGSASITSFAPRRSRAALSSSSATAWSTAGTSTGRPHHAACPCPHLCRRRRACRGRSARARFRSTFSGWCSLTAPEQGRDRVPRSTTSSSRTAVSTTTWPMSGSTTSAVA